MEYIFKKKVMMVIGDMMLNYISQCFRQNMIFYFLFLSLKWRRMYLNDKFSSSFPEFKYEDYIAFLSFSLQENMLSEERVSSFIFQAICTLNNWVVTVLLVYLRGKLFVNKKKACSEIPLFAVQL